MRFLAKFFKNKGIVSFIGLILCVGIIIFAYHYRVNQLTKPVTVPYALVEMTAREEITSDKIGTVKIPSSMVNENVLTSLSDIEGKYVNYNTRIPKGSLFYKSVVVNWENMPDSAWTGIESGHTIVSLPVNSSTTFGSSIYPGDKIDLYYQTTDNKLVLGRLISGIEVLAVKDTQGGHIFKKSADQKEAAALIFSVTEELHLLLKKAMYLNGTLIPVPRNSSYNPETNISSTYLSNLIESQYLKNDIID